MIENCDTLHFNLNGIMNQSKLSAKLTKLIDIQHVCLFSLFKCTYKLSLLT